MTAFWRNLAITVVVALAAGWAGGALGVRTLTVTDEMLPLAADGVGHRAQRSAPQ